MWKGPLVDGVTQSLISRFLRCPFSFYLYAILGLEDPGEGINENLIWGDAYHKGLEHRIQGDDLKESVEKMLEYLNERYPNHPPSFPHSLRRMLTLYRPMKGDWKTEVVIDRIHKVRGHEFRQRGKKDGFTEHDPNTEARTLAEHKCKGYIDPAATKDELVEDLQCNFYMFPFEIEWVHYDLIKIPDVQKYGPARKYDQSPKEWVEMLYTGPVASYGNNYPINRYTHNWLHQGTYFISLEQQELYWDQVINPILLRMLEWYEYVTDPDFDIDDPTCYNTVFYKMPVRQFDGRRTEKFKCEYHAYLTGQIDLEDLVPVESYYSELEDAD